MDHGDIILLAHIIISCFLCGIVGELTIVIITCIINIINKVRGEKKWTQFRLKKEQENCMK